MQNAPLRFTIAALALTTLGACATEANNASTDVSSRTATAASTERHLPALVVTNEPPPDVIYRRGSRDTVLADAAGTRKDGENRHVETLVTRKVAELAADLTQQQHSVDSFRERLSTIQTKSDGLASEYYTTVASIETELQSGTTAGNPILTERWNQAQEKLNFVQETSTHLSELATDISSEASKAAYLQDSVRSTYSLSGAVDEDHKQLQTLEDAVNQNIVAINRLLTSVSDEMNRRASYMRAERLNLQTLSLAIANGELYGQNIANTLYKKAAEDGQPIYSKNSAAMGDDFMNSTAPAARRPLMIIRFDRANVEYQQALYTAVNQVLSKYPNAQFDLVAVSTNDGNPAQVALASSEARKNGEGVLRSLTQMGLPVERVRLSAGNSKDVVNNEVHLYLQ